MRLLHGLAKTHGPFDDPNLVSRTGLVPVMAVAQRAGLADLVAAHVSAAGNAVLRAPEDPAPGCGHSRRADSIDDMDLLRHGAMPDLVWRDPGALAAGLLPAVMNLEDVRHLEAVNRQLPAELARRAAAARPGHASCSWISTRCKTDRRASQAGRRVEHIKIRASLCWSVG